MTLDNQALPLSGTAQATAARVPGSGPAPQRTAAVHMCVEARIAAHARGRERVGKLRDGAQGRNRHLMLNWYLVANGRAARQRVHEEVDRKLGAGGGDSRLSGRAGRGHDTVRGGVRARDGRQKLGVRLAAALERVLPVHRRAADHPRGEQHERHPDDPAAPRGGVRVQRHQGGARGPRATPRGPRGQQSTGADAHAAGQLGRAPMGGPARGGHRQGHERPDRPGRPVHVVTANPREVQGPDDLEEGKRDDARLLIDVQDDQGSYEPPTPPKQETAEANLAYIETKSLDGETNLKIRTAIPLVASLCRGSGDSNRSIDGGGHNELRGVMVCEQPNDRITSFEGTFSAALSPAQAQSLGVPVSDPSSASAPFRPAASLLQTEIDADGLVRVRMPVTAKQMMLRSCVLRNTRSVTGMVVFTGHETKVFCSNTEPVVKTSSVERRLNRLIIGIVFIQQLVCFLGALLGAHWMHTEGDSFWYLISASERRHHVLTGAPTSHPLAELAKLHLRYFIIMQNFVPISLNVSLEFVKYWQAYFIEQDLEMYDKQSDTPAMVRSSALNEDLGRVHHVFTDKTGTLTMNIMLFRYCMVGGKHYGGIMQDQDMEEEVPSQASSPSSMVMKDGLRFVDFDPTELFADLQAGGEQAETLRRFLRHLALCHTLIPTKSLVEMCSIGVRSGIL
ncbi:hypothetical protein ON010_g8997 [Phytophthora cinnamomi]|nr:hypothetical protein ON010_g8997 [Phytophthora cinnamomi]